MDAEQIRTIDAAARAGFTYQPDPPGADLWRSHAADVRAGRAWRGDCDDLASTLAELLIEAGAAPADVYRLEVSAGAAGAADHLVACAWDDQGLAWIVGDTFRPAYLARSCLHRPVSYQRLSEPGVIRQGAPWA